LSCGGPNCTRRWTRPRCWPSRRHARRAPGLLRVCGNAARCRARTLPVQALLERTPGRRGGVQAASCVRVRGCCRAGRSPRGRCVPGALASCARSGRMALWPPPRRSLFRGRPCSMLQKRERSERRVLRLCCSGRWAAALRGAGHAHGKDGALRCARAGPAGGHAGCGCRGQRARVRRGDPDWRRRRRCGRGRRAVRRGRGGRRHGGGRAVWRARRGRARAAWARVVALVPARGAGRVRVGHHLRGGRPRAPPRAPRAPAPAHVETEARVLSAAGRFLILARPSCGLR